MTQTGGEKPGAHEPTVLGPFLDTAPCGFVSFADDGTLRAMNATLLDILGFERSAVIGKHVEGLLTVGSRIFYQTHFFPLLRLHGRAEEIFLLLRARDGDDVATIVNAVRRERDGEWQTECILMVVRERRKFEDALLRAKRDAEAARADAEAQRSEVESINRQLEQQADELEAGRQQLVDQAVELEAQGDELRALNDDLLERTDELERLRTVADEANNAKSTFLAMMSHELRTPLNAIGGYVQLLEMGIHGPVTESQAEVLGRVARSQRHLLRLVNEVLNLARIEAGRVDYALEAVSVADVVHGVLPMIEPQLAARRLQHEVDVASSLTAYADREKVQQILLNLLSNAAKFTLPEGHVVVEASTAPGDAHRVHILVRDSGVGIAGDRLEQVFEPFVQVDASHTRRAEGSGLGLAISRDLARGMGGDLLAESTPGVGSTFTLVLPAAG